MFFKDIPGREELADRLRNTVTEQRVSHAQIFAGSEGTGKLAMALAYAQYVSCQSRTETDSCGVCSSCIKYTRLIHPDLHFVFPIVKSKRFPDPVCDNYLPEWRAFNLANTFFNLNDWLRAIEVENAQAIIYAAEASEILRKLSLKTYEAEYKIMVIWLPEKMHPTAANKLLKLIEEPPDKTLFLLVSEEPEKIIPTILSRCQMIKFKGVNETAIATYLTENHPVTEAQAGEIALIANGNLIKAISLTRENDGTSADLENFRVLMRHAWKRDIAALIEWSDNLAATGREAQKRFLAYALGIIRGNFIMNCNKGSSQLTYMTADETEFSSKFHPFINEKNIQGFFDEFNKAHYHIEANGNAKIIFLDLSLQILRIIKT